MTWTTLISADELAEHIDRCLVVDCRHDLTDPAAGRRQHDEGHIPGAIFISIEAGLLLAAAYLLTRRLWLAMGVHMAWNYTLSAVFSGVVSGGVSDPGLIRGTFDGPELLTGGSFGLESSILALVLCTGAGLIMAVLAHLRGHFLPPPWTRR